MQGVTLGALDDFARLLRFVEYRDLHPIIDTVYPIDKAPEAFKRVVSGNIFGKIAIRIQ